jgi:hypothetical protein
VSIKTFHAIIIIILATSYMHVAVATEVLNPAGDMLLEEQPSGRLRADSWSQRPEVSRAIEAYKTEVEKLVDLFETSGEVWRSVRDVCEGQSFIGDKKIGDKDYVDNASNTRFMYIQDVQKYLKRDLCMTRSNNHKIC